MDKILEAIKCVNCKNVLKSPILLPCTHSICKHHVNESMAICCGECASDHQIPKNGSFLENAGLAKIICANIENLDFGETHKQAKKHCNNLCDSIKLLEDVINDPSNIIYEQISALKSEIYL